MKKTKAAISFGQEIIEDSDIGELEVEPGEGLAVYAEAISAWKAPFEDEPLTAADRRRILARIVDGLAYMGIKAVT